MKTHYLSLSWSTSRGHDTYGYNICRLDAQTTDGMKRYRASGGGYDMTGTVFGNWLTENYQDRLLKIARRAYYAYDGKDSGVRVRKGDQARTEWTGTPARPKVTPGLLYGMTHYTSTKRVVLDGGCGIESMMTIARAIGLDVQTVGNRKGHTTGFIVTDTREA